LSGRAFNRHFNAIVGDMFDECPCLLGRIRRLAFRAMGRIYSREREREGGRDRSNWVLTVNQAVAVPCQL
jgi:hypothetical protein